LGAFEALEEWMEYRRISGEDINGESWLMRTVWDKRTPKRSTIKSPSVDEYHVEQLRC